MAKKSSVNALVCPVCCTHFVKHPGVLSCKNCKRSFPIYKNIPRLVVGVNSVIEEVQQGFDSQWQYTSRDFNSKDYVLGEFVEQGLTNYLLEFTRLERNWFKKKRCLDVGSGFGRYSHALDELGAELYSIDLTPTGVESTKRLAPHSTVAQANLFSLPLKQQAFDLVISIGVLHHTPSTRAAFDRVSRMVKKNGVFVIMVYEKHNPLKLFLTECLRRALNALGKKKMFDACVVLEKIGKITPLRYVGNAFITFGPSRYGNYDCYSAPINHHHTAEEVSKWFEENGFIDVEVTNSELSGWFNHFFRGKHRGIIFVKGVKK